MKLDITMVQKRIKELEDILFEKSYIENMKDGQRIRISTYSGSPRYYLRANSEDRWGTYIPSGEEGQVQEVIQQCYDREILKKAKKELSYLRRFLIQYPKSVVEDVYPGLHPDFMVLNKRTRKEYYWEHLGLMDTPWYAKKAIRRLIAYQRTGIYIGEKLILTFETSAYHPGLYDINQIIDHYLM